ncbi:MAG: toll/interleukin-1 receptor domain-containing protein, partial [Bacillota bacterium]
MDKNSTAFISYSWDSEEHKDWVTSLVNLLRNNGVDATFDVFETQKGTVNLNAMMLKNIKDNDYTIIVLTQNYAKKADAFQGGVGFETNMLISYIQENLQKIIPIMRCKGDKAKAAPFYLSGVHYI